MALLGTTLRRSRLRRTRRPRILVSLAAGGSLLFALGAAPASAEFQAQAAPRRAEADGPTPLPPPAPSQPSEPRDSQTRVALRPAVTRASAVQRIKSINPVKWLSRWGRVEDRPRR